jgi:hypothetical protein
MDTNKLEELMKNFYIDNIIKIYQNETDRNKTKIDEIKKESDKIAHNLTEEEWIKFDNMRLKDKQINNKIGELHEYICCNSNNFCKAPKSLKVDIIKNDYSIFIELKNKYNTLNSSSRENTINRLIKIKKQYNESLCLIGIINGKSFKKKIDEENDIWLYSGDELFELIFNDKNYLKHVKTIISNNMKEWL